MRRLTVVLALAGALWLTWVVYALVAPEREDLLPARVVADAPEEADVIALIARHLQTPVTQGNRVRLLTNGDEIFPPMLEAIDSATDSIRFLSYVYWTGDIADRVAERLAAAAERGVQVRVLLDAWGGRKIADELRDRLERAGVELAWFHPFAWDKLRTLNQRTHRKVLVVDGRRAFVGGVGIAEEWEGDADASDEWRDNHFEVRGEAVTYLEGAFAENWLNATGQLLLGSDVPGAVEADFGVGGDRIAVLSTSPRGDMSPIALAYWTVFATATRSIDIATPYFVPDPALRDALLAAARRGVRVRILLPGARNDSWLVRNASRTYYPALLDAGVEVYEFDPTMTHTKLVIGDGRWSLVGSANFDNRSFELNDEIVLLTDSTALTAQLLEAFEQDLARATLLDADDRSTLDKVRDRLGLPLLLLREQL